MAVHKVGTLAPVTGDLQTTHQGAAVAVKMIQWGSDSMALLALIEKKGTAWEAIDVIYQFDDPTLTILRAEAKVSGGIAAWFKREVLPLINQSLGKRFPATGAPLPPVTDNDLIVQVDQAMLSLLAWAPQADGTLRMATK